MVKSIFIHGLRGFGEARTIEFAIPNGETGSGITFIVGGNNSGKTTILEALRSFNCYTHNKPSFSERKRNKKCEQGKVHMKEYFMYPLIHHFGHFGIIQSSV